MCEVSVNRRSAYPAASALGESELPGAPTSPQRGVTWRRASDSSANEACRVFGAIAVDDQRAVRAQIILF
jgi:hypothetical protein